MGHIRTSASTVRFTPQENAIDLDDSYGHSESEDRRLQRDANADAGNDDDDVGIDDFTVERRNRKERSFPFESNIHDRNDSTGSDGDCTDRAGTGRSNTALNPSKNRQPSTSSDSSAFNTDALSELFYAGERR